MRRIRNKPKLEILESRVLLSAVDTPTVNDAVPADWQTAIQGAGADVSIELLPYNQVLRITGSGHGNLTVDLSRLPASVVNLQISSFDSVTLTGQHDVDSLTVSAVQKVDAGRISISSTLWLNDVNQLKVDVAPMFIWVQGARTGDQVTVGEKTLLEVGSFSSEANATIFGFVKNLGLEVTSRSGTIPTVIGGGLESIFLNFTPAQTLRGSGVPSEATVIKGDFARYFLASPSERVALEQSALITRQAALIDRVPLGALLNANPKLVATLGDGFDAGVARATLRPVGDRLIDTSRLEPGVIARASFRPVETAPETNHVNASELHLDTIAGSDQSMVNKDAALIAASRAPATVAPSVAIDDHNFRLQAASTAASEAVIGALSVALARLQDPFVQTMTALQGRSATFAELAAAQVTGHMSVESRPALLVDGRGSRQERDRQALVVIHV
jgi:hypothetical protein